MKNKTIITADDHPLLLKGLNDFLLEKNYNIIGSANDGKQALALIESLNPDIAILDIQMPNLSGLDVAKICNDNRSRTKIILITFHKEASLYFEAKELNVFGYLLKDFAIEEIENCISSVLDNVPYFSLKIKQLLNLDSSENLLIKSLTPSERKILKYISKDKTTKEIAELLSVSPRTVEKHRSNIIQKLNIEPKTNSLLIWAKEHQNQIS
ncbi:response regulator [Planktosalinus lacus]|uniref:DNA-binding response regulator n=1 Tax=Planktosalinus lacus TaxID=1526573 RepID=A0A8J2Y6L5_9FLAO|nr:response regulator transcription factor [Planktosalinus lacus]GGD82562.1 DNA-binding response regulator [Planktosalinus lacus]